MLRRHTGMIFNAFLPLAFSLPIGVANHKMSIVSFIFTDKPKTPGTSDATTLYVIIAVCCIIIIVFVILIVVFVCYVRGKREKMPDAQEITNTRAGTGRGIDPDPFDNPTYAGTETINAPAESTTETNL